MSIHQVSEHSSIGYVSDQVRPFIDVFTQHSTHTYSQLSCAYTTCLNKVVAFTSTSLVLRVGWRADSMMTSYCMNWYTIKKTSLGLVLPFYCPFKFTWVRFSFISKPNSS